MEGDPARRRLWARLLAGRVTEVCVLSRRGLTLELPQTLGLEVIDYAAYLYDSSGLARPPEERARIAEELAAEPRWLAVGGPRYWVEPFARRAEVILVMPSTAAEMDLRVNSAIYGTIDRVDRYFAALRSGRRRRRQHWAKSRRRSEVPQRADPVLGLTVSVREFVGEGPMSDSQISAHYMWMRNFFLGEYPDKTFVLNSGAQVKELRAVRAVRRT
ncbi:MAG TPA: hypothetical protein VFN97_20990 [Actinospica sp.]|nr:hypothetical protein [Actinospica sp.]